MELQLVHPQAKAVSLEELRGKVLLLEANREELSLQAELLGTKYGALQAEHEGFLLQELQQYLAEVHADSAAARGRSLQVVELQRQVNEHVLQRGQLEAELARLRAEHGALTANPVVMSENPLAQAERWVLYTEIPTVEQTSSLSYPGHILVNFDDEELTSALGPLAAVNFALRIGALAALERGDMARCALKAFCREDLQKRGYLDAAGVHSFVRSVFQHQNLTPPMEDHVLIFYRLFSHEADLLDARSCLCLCDALLRAVLRTSGRRAARLVPVAVAESQGLGLPSWREPPEAEQGSIPAVPAAPAAPAAAAPAVPAAPAAPAALAMKCGFCGAEFEEDSMFCTNCGARRPQVVADLVPPSPARSEPAPSGLPLPTQSTQGRLGSPSHTSHLMPGMCGQRYVAPTAGPQAPRPMVSNKCLDQSRIRTCRPVSAEMGTGSLQTPTQRVAPPTMPIQSMPLTYVRSQ